MQNIKQFRMLCKELRILFKKITFLNRQARQLYSFYSNKQMLCSNMTNEIQLPCKTI